MRELPVTLALSVLVHAAALTVYVATLDPEPNRPVAKTAPALEVAPPAPVAEEPPVEVALLDDDTVARFRDETPAIVAASRPAATARSAKPTTAIVTSTRTATELPPPVAPTPEPTVEPTKKTTLSMRGGRSEPMIHRPGSDGISDEALKQMAEGTIKVKISNLPGAQEAADLDRVNARLGSRRWVQNATPEQLTAARWEREAARRAKGEVELKEQKDGTYVTEKKTFTAKVNRDGTVDLKDKGNWNQTSPLSAELDVTDAFMRRHGQDPYASEKRKYLDRTRDQRVEIGKRYRKEQLGASAQLMANNLARLWATTSDPVKRRAELFALWDECAETGDEDLVEGGKRARQLLINWVHAKHVVFTRAELAAFNARKQSKATFAP